MTTAYYYDYALSQGAMYAAIFRTWLRSLVCEGEAHACMALSMYKCMHNI